LFLRVHPPTTLPPPFIHLNLHATIDFPLSASAILHRLFPTSFFSRYFHRHLFPLVSSFPPSSVSLCARIPHFSQQNCPLPYHASVVFPFIISPFLILHPCLPRGFFLDPVFKCCPLPNFPFTLTLGAFCFRVPPPGNSLSSITAYLRPTTSCFVPTLSVFCLLF